MRRLLILSLTGLALAACEREDREYRANPATSETNEKIALSPLSAGPSGPTEQRSGLGREYEENAYHISQGQRLYVWFNCNGCHANGGGGMGPPLMDDRWIYGGEIQQIAATILQGRPNGMPSFRNRIPDEQVWQIAAYVRSLPRHIRKDVAPGRRDDMQAHEAPNSMPRTAPTGGTVPPSAERPQ
jgi:cytochrome c oxidase cbb3-type subunit 3